jgi:hypothetical protein
MKAYCEEIVEQMKGKKAIAIGVSEDVPGRGVKTLVPMFTWIKNQLDQDERSTLKSELFNT